MFDFKKFVKKGLIRAIGSMADYAVMLNAAEWHKNGVLSEEDLAEIEAIIDSRDIEETEETVTE